MSKFYRFAAIVLVLVLAVSLVGVAGCKKQAKAKIGLVFDVGGLGDKSFNDSAYAGLTKAATDFKVETQYLEPTEGGADREQLLKSLAEQNYPLVIGNGFMFTDSITAVAAQFPKLKFALVDGFVADLTETSNIRCLLFTEHEGSFLVGVAAAMKSENGKIGFIGGMSIPLIQKFEAGYIAGARWFNPNIEIISNYIGSTGDAFKNPTACKEIALAQYNRGADVIYHASGQSGIGLFEAAVEKQKWAIGVDSDQYLLATAEQQPFILTSMLKRIDVAVYQTIKSQVEGTFKGGYGTFNLAVDGVGYSTANTAALTADIVTKLEEAKAKIISGEIVVPTSPE
jgi:basic membrane protein A